MNSWQVECTDIQERTAHLFHYNEWTDCSFEFEAKEQDDPDETTLRAHKLILAMSSPVFAAMFYSDAADQQNSVIKITDIDLHTFTNLLDYIYTEYPDIIDEDDAISLFKAANKYFLVQLEQMCVNRLIQLLDADNVCLIYEFACFYGRKDLIEECFKTFRSKTECVLKYCSLQGADISIVKKIVSMDTLNITSELELFNCLINYANNFKKPDNDSHNMEIQSSIATIKENVRQTILEENNNMPAEKMALHSNSKLFQTEDKRAILNGVIEDIRFLTMSAAELAKIHENNTILSKDELLAIFTNKFSPNSRVPMPVGFSCKREPRNKGAGTIRFTVHNITRMEAGRGQCSERNYIHKLPWRILVKREPNDYLGVYLYCDADILPAVKDDWSCEAKCEFKLFSADPKQRPNLDKFTQTFSRKANNWGPTKYMEWKKLLDPKNNYIKNDSITLEVFVAVEPPQGVDLEILKKKNICSECEMEVN
ncbi:BTB/POZ domain-containing protein [Phthorimaea operculella]|nr:BTB/POZ domain-containing protein [Phthorimaea operculella]